jgi:hypothetical protein
MEKARLWKIWKVSEALLRRSRAALPEPDEEKKEEFEKLSSAFSEYIEHNEHGLALDILEEMGLIVPARGGFWKDLRRLAEHMKLEDKELRIARYEEEFSRALDRLKTTTTESGSERG